MTHVAAALAVYCMPWAVAAVLWLRLKEARRDVGLLKADIDAGARTTIVLDPMPAASGTGDFDADARFDLRVNGARAGYAMTPAQVKTEIVEGLDIDMRRLAGFAPPSR